MAKSTMTYWNPLLPENDHEWSDIEGMEGLAEEITLAMDPDSGDYTRLTRFKPGCDTVEFGPKSHSYPEEILVLQGRLYDAAFDRWLEVGDYASRPAGEVHGPFRSDDGCVVLEMSYPGKSVGLTKSH